MSDFSAIAHSLLDFDSKPVAPRFVAVPRRGFPAASLRGWLALAQASGVPHVPAWCLGELPVDALLSFDRPIDGTENALKSLDRMNDLLIPAGAERMLRWDCCAPWGVKDAMGNGDHRPTTDERRLEIDDPRAFDLLYEYPKEEIPVFVRPWIPALMIEGYPVEFRVFVQNGTILGVSNYYPQRPLPARTDLFKAAGEAVDMTRRLVACAQDRNLTPWMPWVEAEQQPLCSGTLDFLVLPSGQTLLLEGGPGFGYGAHPCCYLESLHGSGGVEPIQGLRLGMGQSSLPLPSADGSLRHEGSELSSKT